jgi:hypothetical protein
MNPHAVLPGTPRAATALSPASPVHPSALYAEALDAVSPQQRRPGSLPGSIAAAGPLPRGHQSQSSHRSRGSSPGELTRGVGYAAASRLLDRWLALRHTMTELDISRNRVRGLDWAALATALAGHPVLTVLSLAETGLGELQPGDSAETASPAMGIIRALMRVPALGQLSIARNPLTKHDR